MVDKQIGNPAGVWGATADTQAQAVVECVNNSGGTLLPGDLVVMTDVNGVLVTTTTTVSDPAVFGVVLPVDRGLRTVAASETYASGAVMPVCVKGPARVNIAANTVAAGGALASSAAAKVAATPTAAASVAALQALVGTFIGNAMEANTAKDANNTIRALIQKM